MMVTTEMVVRQASGTIFENIGSYAIEDILVWLGN